MSARLRRIAITGSGGFIGSRLVARLLTEGSDVRCLRHAATVRQFPPGREQVSCDFTSLSAVTEALQDVRTVFHLGGMASSSAAQASPAEAFRANTWSTQNILEAALRNQVERVVLLSTAGVYGSASGSPVTEDSPLAPASIYAATKLAGDTLALAYYKSYGLPVSVLRCFNVYGPGQVADAVIPTIVSQALQKPEVSVRSLRPKRDFVFVEDVVDALCLATRSEAVGCALLVSSGLPISIAQLIRTTLSLVLGRHVSTPEDEPDGGDCLYGTSARAKEMIGWRPSVSLTEGLEKTLEWWRQAKPLPARVEA
jgi:nucleoside-diphosphate-sugar epimerase